MTPSQNELYTKALEIYNTWKLNFFSVKPDNPILTDPCSKNGLTSFDVFMLTYKNLLPTLEGLSIRDAQYEIKKIKPTLEERMTFMALVKLEVNAVATKLDRLVTYGPFIKEDVPPKKIKVSGLSGSFRKEKINLPNTIEEILKQIILSHTEGNEDE